MQALAKAKKVYPGQAPGSDCASTLKRQLVVYLADKAKPGQQRVQCGVASCVWALSKFCGPAWAAYYSAHGGRALRELLTPSDGILQLRLGSSKGKGQQQQQGGPGQGRGKKKKMGTVGLNIRALLAAFHHACLQEKAKQRAAGKGSRAARQQQGAVPPQPPLQAAAAPLPVVPQQGAGAQGQARTEQGLQQDAGLKQQQRQEEPQQQEPGQYWQDWRQPQPQQEQEGEQQQEEGGEEGPAYLGGDEARDVLRGFLQDHFFEALPAVRAALCRALIAQQGLFATGDDHSQLLKEAVAIIAAQGQQYWTDCGRCCFLELGTSKLGQAFTTKRGNREIWQGQEHGEEGEMQRDPIPSMWVNFEGRNNKGRMRWLLEDDWPLGYVHTGRKEHLATLDVGGLLMHGIRGVFPDGLPRWLAEGEEMTWLQVGAQGGLGRGRLGRGRGCLVSLALITFGKAEWCPAAQRTMSAQLMPILLIVLAGCVCAHSCTT